MSPFASASFRVSLRVKKVCLLLLLFLLRALVRTMRGSNANKRESSSRSRSSVRSRRRR